ncbi:YHYH domain-containing protein [Novosphingobium sp.]|uniref:YHYH domain-containing protein n=1 Tax=Novosphingobium sp. TaxID=1874826 RepID=UPI0035B0140D
MRARSPLIAAGLCCLASAADAHPGGLNAEGCHNNRETGDYHCHRSPSPPPPPQRSDVYYPNCAAVPAAGAEGQTEDGEA